MQEFLIQTVCVLFSIVPGVPGGKSKSISVLLKPLRGTQRWLRHSPRLVPGIHSPLSWCVIEVQALSSHQVRVVSMREPEVLSQTAPWWRCRAQMELCLPENLIPPWRKLDASHSPGHGVPPLWGISHCTTLLAIRAGRMLWCTWLSPRSQ